MTKLDSVDEAFESEFDINTKIKQFFIRIWKKEKLMLFIIFGVIVGMLVGTLANPYIRNLSEPTRSDALVGAEFLGNMFLQCLRLVILPLIVSSLIRGMASLDTKSAGKVGIAAMIFYFCTTVLAVVLAIILVIAISPGTRATYAVVSDNSITQSRTLDLFLDIIRNLFPENIIQATFQTVKTSTVHNTVYDNPHVFQLPMEFGLLSEAEKATFIEENSLFNITIDSSGVYSAFQGNKRSYLLPGQLEYNNGLNMLGLITFCIVFGIFLGQIKEQATTFLSILETIETVTIKMITLIMWFSPIGIFSLIVGQFWKIDDVPSAFASLGLYLVTVVSGLIIHLFVTVFLIYFAFTRKNPLIYLKNMLKAILTAFATASSSATIPITLECLDSKNGIDKRISRFMIPVGATVNMNGTALYEAVAALFIAQVYGVELNAGKIIVMSITATMTSVGAAGVPGGALVTLVIVMQVLGLPSDSLGLVLSIDWLLDRFMTIENVLGDAFGCGVVQGFFGKHFSISPEDTIASEETCNATSLNYADEAYARQRTSNSEIQITTHDARL